MSLFQVQDMNLANQITTVLLLAIFMVHESSSCTVINSTLDLSNGFFSGTTLYKENFTGCPYNVATLDLSFNSIETIDDDAFNPISNIQLLNISHNNLKYFQEGTLKYLRNLLYFDASYNSLTYINESLFAGLVNLREIHLQYNKIAILGFNTFHKDMANLLLANVSHNMLTSFEAWPYIPQQIPDDSIDLIFDFTYNIISVLSNEGNWTYNLIEQYESYVNLQNNNITTIDVVSKYNPTFDNSNRGLLSEYLTFRINATLNPFFCDCNLYDMAYDIHDSIFLYTRIEEFRYRCGGPPELAGEDFMHDITLDRLVCNITTDCPNGCFCQERPHTSELYVDCTNGNLNELPKTLPTPRYGNISLHLDKNSIRELNYMPYMAFVRNLTISNNRLAYADSEVFTKHMQYADLSTNQLEYLPESIQKLPLAQAILHGNIFQCACNMTWMKSYIELYSQAEGASLSCDHDGKSRQFTDVTDETLNCDYNLTVILITSIVGVFVAVVIGLLITAYRCPYETKALAYEYFGVHPRDKYKVDQNSSMEHDAYICCDFEDVQVRQWLITLFLRKFKDQSNKLYSFYCTPLHNDTGRYMQDEIVNNMRKSRRIIVLLSPGFFDNKWCDFEAIKAEEMHNSSDKNKTRVIYVLWNDTIRDILPDDTWRSRTLNKRVLCPDEKFFWSKLKYELPVKGMGTTTLDDLPTITIDGLDQPNIGWGASKPKFAPLPHIRPPIDTKISGRNLPPIDTKFSGRKHSVFELSDINI